MEVGTTEFSIVYSIMFGLAFMLGFLCINHRKQPLTTGLLILIAISITTYIGNIIHVGRNLSGVMIIMLMMVLLPTLIQTIVNKKFTASYLYITIIVWFISALSDVLSAFFAKMLDPSFKNYVYCAILPISDFFFASIGKRIYDKLRNQPKRENLLYVFGIMSIIIFLLFFLILLWALNVIYSKPNMVLFIAIIMILLVFLGLFMLLLIYYIRYIKTDYDKELMEKEISNIVQSAKMIEITYERLKSFRHDYKNIILSLSLNENSEGMRLLREWEKDFVIVDSQYENIIMQLMIIENLPFKSLVSSKAIYFINNNISININIIGKIKTFYIEDFDLIRILGIFLDNAFEEAKCTEEQWISMGILADNESVTIIIENSCRKTTPSADCIIQKGFSTKSETRGIGLSNVSDIISQYKHCSYQLGKRESNIFYVETTLRSS